MLLPIVFLPLLLLGLAVVWLFSAAGVFVRDLQQISPILSMLLLFLSGVFYPLDRLDGILKIVVMLNPLALIIDNARRVTFYGEMPDWLWLGACLAVSWFVAWVAFRMFSEGRRLFVDVL